MAIEAYCVKCKAKKEMELQNKASFKPRKGLF